MGVENIKTKIALIVGGLKLRTDIFRPEEPQIRKGKSGKSEYHVRCLFKH